MDSPMPSSLRRLLARWLGIVLLISSVGLGARAWGQAPEGEEVERVTSNLVTLNVTVTQKDGHYVTDLKAKDFEVLEDGRPQVLNSFGLAQTPFAVAVLLDTSGSMETQLPLARSAVIRFLDGLRDTDAAAVYHFDSRTEQVQDFSASRDLAPLAFSLKATGQTSLYDAIGQAITDLAARSEKRKALVVLSDGLDNHSRLNHKKAVAAALAANVTIHAVDFSPPNDRDAARLSGVLRDMTTQTGGRFVSAKGGVGMREAFTAIVGELGQQYTLSYIPPTSGQPGQWHPLEVRIPRPNLTIRTRTGYRTRGDK